MASLLALMNRAVSYFKKAEVSTDEEVLTDEEQLRELPLYVCTDSEMREEVSTDEQISTDDEQLCEPPHPNICIACNKEIPDMYYKHEHRMCRCCHEISLVGEKQCGTCGQMKDISLFGRPYLFRYRKCVNARAE
jgi:hypothetical protein